MTTAQTMESGRRPDGMDLRHALVLPLVAILLVVWYSLVATGTARADGPPPQSDPAATGVPDATADTPAPAPGGADAQVSTDQAAAATAEATQQEPGNLVVLVRVDSPGDDGGIEQQNSAVATGSASNDASTAQDDGAAAAGGAQQAATGQAALGAAAAAQQQAQNIVIVIRINSPGNNGPISQTNNAAASAAAVNNADTTQGGPNGGGSADAGGGTLPDPRVPIGPPAQQASPAASGGGATPAPVAEQAPTGPKTAVPGRSARRPTSDRGSSRSIAPRVARKSSRPAAKSVPVRHRSVPSRQWHTAPSTAPAASGAHRPSAGAGSSSASAPVRGPATSGVSRRAVDLLGSLPRTPSLDAGERTKDVSSAVVYTLIAVLVAAAVFLVSTFRLAGLRVVNPRTWRHG